MQYFADGGPGPGTKLVRVDYDDAVETMEDVHRFSSAAAENWSVRDGWTPSTTATSDIFWGGWLGRIDEDQVSVVQDQLRASAAQYRKEAASISAACATEKPRPPKYIR